MKKLLVPLLLGGLAAACTDGRQPLDPRAAPGGPRLTLTPSSPDVGTYWRTPDTLTVFDKRPELGIAAVPDHFGTLPGTYGMKLVRTTLYYDNPNSYTSLDATVAAARAAGVELEVVVHSTSNCKENHADPYGDFATFMYNAASRYPDIRFWELWNEQDFPDWTNFFGASGPHTVDANGTIHYSCVPGSASLETQGYNYAQMLKQAYPRIKAANPNAWVLMGGLSAPNDARFLNGVYQGGGKRYYDFANMHAYADVTSRAQAFAVNLAQNGDAGRPVWLTEFGRGAVAFNGVLPHNTPPQQDGPTYDADQKSWWQAVLDDAASSRRFVKLVGYRLENLDPVYNAPDSAILPTGMWRDDYGAGVQRATKVPRDLGFTPPVRPLFTYLTQRAFNSAVFATPSRGVTVLVESPGMVPAGFSYAVVAQDMIDIYNVNLNNRYPTQIRMVPGNTDYPQSPACTPTSCPFQ
jgi:hypothetical protein